MVNNNNYNYNKFKKLSFAIIIILCSKEIAFIEINMGSYIDNCNYMKRDDEFYFNNLLHEPDFKETILDSQYFSNVEINEFNTDDYFSLFIQKDELNNGEIANSKEDVPENVKEISNDNNLDKEKEKDKIIETSSSKTKKYINNSDKISMKKDEIDEITASLVEKNKEDNTLKIEDKNCEKEDINKILGKDKEKKNK